MRARVRAVLVDLSGTLHVGGQPTPGAVKALEKLRATGVAIKFVTNTTKDSAAKLLQRLHGIGFAIQKQEIYSSLSRGLQLVTDRSLRPYCILTASAREDFAHVDQSDPNAVLVGLAPEDFRYSRLNPAFQLLLQGAPLIALHAGRYYKGQDGLSLGPGAFVKGLEYSAGVTAEVVGKPQPSFFLGALAGMGACEPGEVVMVGDDVQDDTYGAMKLGMRGVLVRTGKYRDGDENTSPTQLCAGIADSTGSDLSTATNSTGSDPFATTDTTRPTSNSTAPVITGPTQTCDTFADVVDWIIDNHDLGSGSVEA